MPPRGRVQVSITADPSGLQRGVSESEAALGKLGTTGSKVNKQVGEGARTAGGHLAGLAKAALGAAAGFEAISKAKEAVDTTTELAHATLVLHRNLGLSIKTASEWAGVAKVRGIETKALSQSFGTLSKQFVALDDGSKKTVKSFASLGITQKQLKSENFEQKLSTVADAFGKMHGGAQRAALGMQLFGRGWQTVLPLMSSGSKSMNEQLALAQKYGVTFGGKTVKSMEDLIRAQREAKFATLGLQVAFGTQLAPALTKGISAVTKLVAGFRDGTGEGGKLKRVFDQIVSVLRPLGQLLKDHPKLIAGAVAAWGLYRAAGVAATAVTRGKIIASFLGLGPKAAAAGAETGTAFGAASATRAGAAMKAFAWAGVGLFIGEAITKALQPQLDGIAQTIANFVTGIDPKKTAAAERTNTHNLRSDTAKLTPKGQVGHVYNPATGKMEPVKGTQKTPTINLNDVVSGKHHPRPAPHPGTARAHTSSVRAHTAVAHAASVATGGPVAHAASSGRYTAPELAALWIRAGGNPAHADMAAAIALAESTGDPNAGRDHPYHGLWQIGPGGPWDPLANAKEAVRKSYNGTNWNAWTTYTGYDTPGHAKTYKQFLGQSGMGAGTASTGGFAAAAVGGGRRSSGVPSARLGAVLTRAPSRRIGHTGAAGVTGFTQTGDIGTPSQGQQDIQRKFQIGVRLQAIARLLRHAKGGQRAQLLAERGTLTTELAGIGVDPNAPTGADAIPGATAYLSSLNRQAAEAALTPDTADDTDIAKRTLAARQAIYDYEKSHGGFSDDAIAQAATDLKSAKDAVDQGSSDTSGLKQSIDDLNATIKQQVQFATSVAGVTSMEAVRALADIISGQIAGIGYTGRALTAGDGSIARW